MRVLVRKNFLDAIDAGLTFEAWLDSWVTNLTHDQRVQTSIERYGLRRDDPTALPEGKVIVIWVAGLQAAIATMMRTEFNWTSLTIVDTMPDSLEIS